ncbi:hypothetical protein J5X84_39805 [Streptosporangiaceae bacterium NEAU-GS5]|nr:hypothetical protein [Streptosporangiaceae bacterium NEAU-GS5]
MRLADPTLAFLAIHEFQHVKLSTVLSARDFYDQEGACSPSLWWDGPRPLEGPLQEAYGHLAVMISGGAAATSTLMTGTSDSRWLADTAKAIGLAAQSCVKGPYPSRCTSPSWRSLAIIHFPVSEHLGKEADDFD